MRRTKKELEGVRNMIQIGVKNLVEIGVGRRAVVWETGLSDELQLLTGRLRALITRIVDLELLQSEKRSKHLRQPRQALK